MDTGRCSGIILMGFTFTLLAANIFWIVLQYTQFKQGVNITFMTITAIGIAAMYGLVLIRTRKDASVLTSGIAAVYILYLQWSALSANPNGNQNL